MAATSGSEVSVAEEFAKQIRIAQSNVKAVGFLGIVGGAFVLVYMLAPAARGSMIGNGLIEVAFLAGGTIGLFIGAGLLNFSESARQAGSMWFLAWGLLNIIGGFAAAMTLHGILLPVFALVSGAIQILLAGVLAQSSSAFVCQYLANELTDDRIVRGVKQAAADASPDMQKFLAKSGIDFAAVKPSSE